MKCLTCLPLALLMLVAVKEVIPSELKKLDPCIDCHKDVQAEYKHSRMAVAAQTMAFLEEWQGKGKDVRCLDCHAPSGQDGVVCIDCHGGGDHPYPKLKVPQVCARCHDAPGEVTVRSYRDSPAVRQGKDCLDCHLEGERTGHYFRGPSRPGFLEGVASLKMSMRRDGDGYTALIRVGHSAGHALPGGTTGRSVWLVVKMMDKEGKLARKSLFRFGWYHDPEMGWQNKTLPPGPGKVIEVPLVGGEMSGSVQATLIYRFLPGGMERSDPDQVILARARFDLPGK